MTLCQLPDDTVMSPGHPLLELLKRDVLLAFVLPFCCNDTTPNCNWPTKEVSQYILIIPGNCAYYSPKLEGHLLFSNYSRIKFAKTY